VRESRAFAVVPKHYAVSEDQLRALANTLNIPIFNHRNPRLQLHVDCGPAMLAL
jgi:hypothetical protein